MHNSVKLILLLSACLVMQFSFAQSFSEAPNVANGKPISKIVEWVDEGDNNKAEKGLTYLFDEKGKLLYFENGDKKHMAIWAYDEKDRLETVVETEGELTTKQSITYRKKSREVLLSYRTRDYKTIDFFDAKNRKVESKVYIRGEDVGPKWVIKDRKVYNYDSRDSLFGEMYYSYQMKGGGPKVLKRKTIHTFAGADHRKVKSVFYDFDQTERIVTDYIYDSKGVLQSISEKDMEEEELTITDFKYKNGKPWQEIKTVGNFKSVKIYKDDLLIRTRNYLDGKILNVIDYQYFYF